MWTAVHLSVQVTLDLARWHASALWLDDPSVEPVMLNRGGDVRVHPYDSPPQILARVLAEVTRDGAETEWELR